MNVVNLKGWKWLPGSVCVNEDGFRYRISDNAGDCYPCDGHNGWENVHDGIWAADLRDNATLSNLEECVRRAWGIHAHVATRLPDRDWQVRDMQAPSGAAIHLPCYGTKVYVLTEALKLAKKLDYDPRVPSEMQSEYRARRITNGPDGEIRYGK